MRFDKQTLAWVNINHKWLYRTHPPYSGIPRGGWIREGPLLPDTLAPNWHIYHDEKTGKQHTFLSDGWGSEKWHHSVNLVDNECECDRCFGISDEWDEYNIIKRKIKEMIK